MQRYLIHAFHAGTVVTFSRSDGASYSTFGGPIEIEVRGKVLSRPLHQIAHLNHNELKAIAPPRYVWDLPLLYGMTYDGCLLEYGFDVGLVTIEQISPAAPSDDWPYRNYPALLPYVHLTASGETRSTWQEFCALAPNLPEDQPAELVVLVPPPVGLGFTLWGRSGDAEGVTLVFECSLTEKRVSAYNVCS